jgi:hypothetical protein
VSAPTIEQKIHFHKGTKAPRVKITRATRSKGGFALEYYKASDSSMKVIHYHPTKKGALNECLAQIRCVDFPVFVVRKFSPKERAA